MERSNDEATATQVDDASYKRMHEEAMKVIQDALRKFSYSAIERSVNRRRRVRTFSMDAH